MTVEQRVQVLMLMPGQVQTQVRLQEALVQLLGPKQQEQEREKVAQVLEISLQLVVGQASRALWDGYRLVERW